MNRVKQFCGKSLRRELLVASFVSIGVGIGIAFILLSALLNITDRTVYGEQYTRHMAKHHADKIQEYVNKHEISTNSLYKMDEYLYMHSNKVYFYFYTQEGILYEPVQESIVWYAENEEITDYSHEESYIVTLYDGTEVFMYLSYYPGDGFYVASVIVAVIIGSLSFAFLFILFINKKTQYIRTMKRELDILAGGNLEYQVSVTGEDELAILAQGINAMKETIVARQRSEEQAKSANAELVTAMSHDLRSPLTVLIGYLEILNRRKFQDEEQARYFAEHSLKKAFQIKEMSDKLFEYFLVYSKDFEQVPKECIDVDLLVGEVLNDMVYALRTKGISVDMELKPLRGMILANVDYFKRVFDNIYSNIIKYADIGKIVTVTIQRKNEYGEIRISNYIASAKDKKESTCIGLKTCKEIMRFHEGDFYANIDGDQFECLVIFNIY